MRRTILLLVTVALTLLLVGGVATSKQRQEESTSSQSSTTSDKSGGDVSVQSTNVKASFARGSGANFLGVKVSNHGNMLSFESPANQEAVWLDNEGYQICAGAGAAADAHDTGNVEGGFGTPTFSQPNGAGTFPLTVTRNTTDGKFQLKQVWTQPDYTEKDVTVTMTLKNISSSGIADVGLSRTGEFDVGPTGSDLAASTMDSLWQWDDGMGGPDSPAVGLMLTALTFKTDHAGIIETTSDWQADGGGRESCSGSAQTTPTAAGDFAMRAFYLFGNLSAGQSKTVKFEYGRM